MGTMNSVSKRSYKINIKNPVYCKVLTDTAEGTTYGPVKSLGEAMQADVSASVATGALYGDGAQVDSAAKLVGFSLGLDITKVPVEARADIYNLDVVDGVVVEKSSIPSYIAVGYEVEQSGGDSEYVWFLKGMPQPFGGTVQQATDSINYSTDTMNINFVRRVSDNGFRYFADSANADFTAAQATAWFTNGPSAPVAKVSGQ